MTLSWKLLHSKLLQSCRVFNVKKVNYRSPRTGQDHDFFIIESPDWVNVIPLTPEGNVILVKQFRFGTQDFSLEIPGGMLDDGDTPAEAASRELIEETGYAGDEPVLIGTVYPNPAIHNNRCYTFLIKNVSFKNPPRQDSTEDIEVLNVPLGEIPRFIREGKITHALVIAAFYWYLTKTGSEGSRIQGFK